MGLTGQKHKQQVMSMTPPVRPDSSDTPPPNPARKTAKRPRRGWKGRRTPLRNCGAPGDEVWEERGAGE